MLAVGCAVKAHTSLLVTEGARGDLSSTPAQNEPSGYILPGCVVFLGCGLNVEAGESNHANRIHISLPARNGQVSRKMLSRHHQLD